MASNKSENGQTATQEQPEAAEAVQVATPEVMDEAAVKALTVEQIKELTIYQLVGLDGRHDLLTAEQSLAVAETLQDRVKSNFKETKKRATEQAKQEQERAWHAYLETLAPQIIENAESGMRRRVEYASIRVYRDGDKITYKESTKYRGFKDGETPFKASQDEPAQAAD